MKTYITKIIEYNGQLCLVLPKYLRKYGWVIGSKISFEKVDKNTIKIKLVK